MVNEVADVLNIVDVEIGSTVNEEVNEEAI